MNHNFDRHQVDETKFILEEMKLCKTTVNFVLMKSYKSIDANPAIDFCIKIDLLFILYVKTIEESARLIITNPNFRLELQRESSPIKTILNKLVIIDTVLEMLNAKRSNTFVYYKLNRYELKSTIYKNYNQTKIIKIINKDLEIDPTSDSKILIESLNQDQKYKSLLLPISYMKIAHGLTEDWKSEEFKHRLKALDTSKITIRNAIEYLTKTLSLQPKLVVIALDFTYHNASMNYNSEYFEDSLKSLFFRLKKFFNSKRRSSLKHMVGYLKKFEFSITKGDFFHVIMFFDERYVIEDQVANEVITDWNDLNMTFGKNFQCLPSYISALPPLNKQFLTINKNSFKAIEAFKNSVIPYMVKSEHYLEPKSDHLSEEIIKTYNRRFSRGNLTKKEDN